MATLHELYPQKAAPARSRLVATLNDPYLIAVVLFCLFCRSVCCSLLPGWAETNARDG